MSFHLNKWLLKKNITFFLVIALGAWMGYLSPSSLNLERALTAIQRPHADQREWGWRKIFTLEDTIEHHGFYLKRVNRLLPNMNDVCLHDAVLSLLNANKFGWPYQQKETLLKAALSFIKSGHPASAQLGITLIQNAPLDLSYKDLIDICHYSSVRADLATIEKLRNAALLWAGTNHIKSKNILKSIDRINEISLLPWEQLIWTLNKKERNLFFLKKNKLTNQKITKVSRHFLSNANQTEIESLLQNFTNLGKDNPIEMAALALKINQTDLWCKKWIDNFKTSVRIAGLLTASISDLSRTRREMLQAQTLGKTLSDIATLSVLPIKYAKKNKKHAHQKALILALSSDKTIQQAALIILNILNNQQTGKLTYETLSGSIPSNITIALTSIFYPEWLEEVKILKDADLIAQALQGRWKIDQRHLNSEH